MFAILHWIITPYREKIKARHEQLTKLYSPLYGLLIARLEIGNKINPDRLTLGNVREHDYLSKNAVEKLIYDNLGYASPELISIWAKYTTSIRNVSPEIQEQLIKTVIIDFNKLRKLLRLPYNEEEMSSGIPEIYKHLR
ncbi:hypothetical protein ACFLFF_30500 [Brevibacillus reuszeri]|uniref:hypothetical protein n=1 Tax=Brevibacillus reuszeri TaxID=54915 RepID=UPI003672E788